MLKTKLLAASAALAVVAGFGGAAPVAQAQAPATAAAPTPADAKAFIDKAETDLARLSEYVNKASWVRATYITEEEIDAARDRSLLQPEQGAKAIESKLGKVNKQLTDLKKQAETLATQQNPLPAHLLEEVSVTLKEVSGLEADLAQRKVQSDSIRARYEADKHRFRELKGAAPQ